MRFIFNLYSTFNALFNIQISIQHSTIHFKFNSSFTHLVSDAYHCLLKTRRRCRRGVVRMSAKEIESHEDDTSLHFDVESKRLEFIRLIGLGQRRESRC